MHEGLIQQMKRFENKHSASCPGADFTISGDNYSDSAVNEAWKEFEAAEWKLAMGRVGPGSGPFPGRGQKRTAS